MRTISILKKELRVDFASPMAYVLYSAFLLIAGWIFVSLIGFAVQNTMSEMSIMEELFRPLYRNLVVVFLFLAPAITMRLLSEEKRMGTIELLFTYPVTDVEILAGKFFSALVFWGILLLPTVVYPLFINHFSPVEWRVVGIQYLGFFLFGACCLAVGVWASSITENQIVAYVISFFVLLTFWIIGWMSQSYSAAKFSGVLAQLSLLNHFNSFSKGVLNTNDLSFYVLFTAFFLYLALKGLGSRGWQGAKE